jgi:hypothetical protein
MSKKEDLIQGLKFVGAILGIAVVAWLWIYIFAATANYATQAITKYNATISVNPVNGACYRNNLPCIGVPVQGQ